MRVFTMMKRCLVLMAFVFAASQVFAENDFQDGPITTQAIKFGASTCVSEIRAIDKFLNEKAGANGAWSSAAKEHPEKRIYSALNIKKFNDGTWGYGALTVSPGAGNCDGTLMQIVTFPGKTCNLVRETTYKDYEYAGELAGKVIYQRNSTKAVLEDLTGSCIAIRYETLYPVPK